MHTFRKSFSEIGFWCLSLVTHWRHIITKQVCITCNFVDFPAKSTLKLVQASARLERCSVLVERRRSRSYPLVIAADGLQHTSPCRELFSLLPLFVAVAIPLHCANRAKSASSTFHQCWHDPRHCQAGAHKAGGWRRGRMSKGWKDGRGVGDGGVTRWWYTWGCRLCWACQNHPPPFPTTTTTPPLCAAWSPRLFGFLCLIPAPCSAFGAATPPTCHQRSPAPPAQTVYCLSQLGPVSQSVSPSAEAEWCSWMFFLGPITSCDSLNQTDAALSNWMSFVCTTNGLLCAPMAPSCFPSSLSLIVEVVCLSHLVGTF